GFNPIIFEKEQKVGAGRHGDYEGLDNWIFSRNVPAFFKESGFHFSNITSYPIYRFNVHTQLDKPIIVQNNQPFFYMVKRGSGPNDLDYQLYRQCIEVGVRFEFGKKAPETCQIIATGTRKAAAFIRGINFKTNLKNQVHLLLGSQFAPKGYAYLIIIDGQGTLATAFKNPKNLESNPLQNCLEYFSEIGIKIRHGIWFGSRGSFSLPFGSIRSPYQIGEAGGFQDYLFGFGIRMSMMSGRAAALSILGNKKESEMILKELNRKRRLSFVNRIIYEQLSDKRMAGLAKKLSEKSNPLSILADAYTWNFKNILRWINMRYRYEVRPT
ncbi:MAG: hypothetical protein ISR82_05950, partial [Candidatus Marinimicrobia bacterium]|nr:hypothetical protein [Candidatus Neomarinimicrobiota bacterium]MBL7031151.1 hypothetical protein [Candidatus Neomarinimicrobiota bacterium]